MYTIIIMNNRYNIKINAYEFYYQIFFIIILFQFLFIME
jgi:hypothetical protein